jgi:hypothetical protein
MATSILIIGQTVIGFGFGPLLAGGISDALSGQLGTESLRYAMLIAPACVFIGWGLTLVCYRALERQGAAV